MGSNNAIQTCCYLKKFDRIKIGETQRLIFWYWSLHQEKKKKKKAQTTWEFTTKKKKKEHPTPLHIKTKSSSDKQLQQRRIKKGNLLFFAKIIIHMWYLLPSKNTACCRQVNESWFVRRKRQNQPINSLQPQTFNYNSII